MEITIERNIQLAPDWTIPAALTNLESGDSGLLLFGASDYEGVPVTHTFEAVQQSAAWLRKLHTQAPTTELIDAINQGITEHEVLYPDAPQWDRKRFMFVQELITTKRGEKALDLILGMRSVQLMLDSVEELEDGCSKEVSGPYGHTYITELAKRLAEMQAYDKRRQLLGAYIDKIIAGDPTTDEAELDKLEQGLADGDPDFDAVQRWADSQRELHPQTDWGIDWDIIATFIKNDDNWGDISIHYRRFIMLEYVKGSTAIHNEPDISKAVSVYIDDIAYYSHDYPNSPVWDSLRWILAEQLSGLGKSDLIALIDQDKTKRDEIKAFAAELRQQGQEKAE